MENQKDQTTTDQAVAPVKASDTTRQENPAVVLETVVALLVSRTVKEAAEKLGIHRSTLYDRINEFGIRQYLNEIPRAALDSLRGASIKAAMNLVDDLNSTRPKIRQDASKYILDKALPEDPKVQVTLNQQNNTYVSLSDFIGEMKKRKQAREGANEHV